MKKKEHKLADGDAGIYETVKDLMIPLIVRDASDPVVTKQAAKLQGKDNLETTKNIFNYVVSSFKYKEDPPGIEHFTAPKYLIAKEFDRHLDCDDMVGILATLLSASGIPCRIKVIAWRMHDYTHVILDVKLDGRWIPLDPVKGRGGFGYQHKNTIRYKTFDVPMRKAITLEDGPCGRGRNRGGNSNVNNILIGNSADESNHLRGGPQNRADVRPTHHIVEVPGKDRIIKVPITQTKYKFVKQPVRVIAKTPVQLYREFY